jgi:L-2-hydroxyglutarate oxidase LhgO
MTQAVTCEYLVIGAGIVGLAIARELSMLDPQARVVVVDKENRVGMHGSGRNSGVLHAGFYYAPDSLKASLTRDGNALLREFLAQHNVAVRECGKVVVASNENQLSSLGELARRGIANGVELYAIDEKELRDLEPRARTFDRALWSPTTAVADPAEVIAALLADVRIRGIDVRLGEHVTEITQSSVTTNATKFSPGHTVNCAGLYADRIATLAGLEHPYVMLPFKGLYWHANLPAGFLTRHVYPVPDPKNPFLGVHATVTVAGEMKIGPTAIPALSRENYEKLVGVNPRDLGEVARYLPQFLSSPHHDAKELVRSEVPKYLKNKLVEQAALLVPELTPSMFDQRLKPGIRAQLFDTSSKRLEMDFVVRNQENCTHVLNAVSPAWTSSLSFAKHVVASIHRP